MYTIVMIMLNKLTKKYKENFKKEVNFVQLQFSVFLIAYISRMIIMIPLEIPKLKELLGIEFILMVHLAVAPVLYIIPTFVILNMHHKAFRARL